MPNVASAEIKFSGDIRLRYEGQFREDLSSRNRFRVRFRLAVAAGITDKLDVGARVITGDPKDPTSPNQSFDDFLSGKNFTLDRFYINYKPTSFLKLVGGKFANPFLTTEMFWDGDVNPEGAAEQFTFKSSSSAVNKVTLTAGQYVINEVSSGTDSYLMGGQGAVEFGIGKENSLTLAGGAHTFLEVDQMAVALDNGTLTSGNTNRVVRDAGAVTGYLSDYDIVDFIAMADFKLGRVPVKVIFDYTNNTGADDENKGYWIESHWGKRKQQGDLDFYFAYARVEPDVVVAAFNNDDLPSTNFKGVEVDLTYQLLKSEKTSTIFRFSGFFTNRVLVPEGQMDNLATKLRFNVVVSF